MAVSNNVIGAVNVLAMLLSIPIIGTGIWLANETESSCVKVLQWPIIIIGVLILIIAIFGIVGGFWKIAPLVIIYLIAMLVMIILLTALVVGVFMVTARGAGHLAPSRAFLEYKLDDFSGWIRSLVQGPFKWSGIKSCLTDTSICADLNQTSNSAQSFFSAPLSPVESGCCKPPTECGYTFVNPTNWISPIDTAADMDCLAWNNDQTLLCFSCDSCKAGLLASLRKQWRQANVILIVTLIAILGVFLIGCCAFRNFKTEDLSRSRKYKQGYT